ncbi:MAG: hypothetical protein K0U98_23165 [Deltaproteobacteria bacterium]|nr:hypothetical protein [Deltaproteobacteria bacterium]
MKILPTLSSLAIAGWLILMTSCAEVSPPPAETLTSTKGALALDTWWSHLESLCGKAYGGSLVSEDEVDARMVDLPMTIHVRRCAEQRIEVPVYIGDDRSRTWVLTRTQGGLKLQHDHRHEDGTEETVNLYGGLASSHGTEVAQFFPADGYSQKLFKENNLAPSVDNVWSMEIVSGKRFSYHLRRPNRHFQIDFDLTQTVDPPPAPWGAEDS